MTHPAPLRWKPAVLLCAVTFIFFWNATHPVIRFTSPLVNDLLSLFLGLGLPWAAAAAILMIGRWWSSKVMGIVILLPLLFYSFLFVFALLNGSFKYKNGHDLNFDQFTDLSWHGSNLRLYRATIGTLGATDVGVVIRQERSLLPGVLLVRNIDNFYPCRVLFAATTESGVTVTKQRFEECLNFRGQLREYRLKRFIYF